MKQTAMQEHVEWLKSTLEICEEHATPLINCLKLCISDAESKLEMEKEQIINFANGWFKETLKSSKIVTIEQYYNETYGKDEK